MLTLNGIPKQRSVPRTPEQDGVAERMNRTIQETARPMLHAAKLPNDFWGEAVATAVILRNRSPTKAAKDMTPYESFYGIKPAVTHLKVHKGYKSMETVVKNGGPQWPRA